MRCPRATGLAFWDRDNTMCSQGLIAFDYLTWPTPTRPSSAKENEEGDLKISRLLQ